MIPGAVGHNYSEDHHSAPRARRTVRLISQVPSEAKRWSQEGDLLDHI
jgi:hypothetical protein